MTGGTWGRCVLAVAALALGSRGAAAAEVWDQPTTSPHLGTCGTETGGFRLPGTDGCLRLNGFVAAEGGMALASPNVSLSRGTPVAPRASGPDLSRSALGVGTRLTADVNLPTDYGPVRLFMSLRTRNGLATDRATR